MTVAGIFFAVCALIALVGALATVAARSPIRSAVGLLTTIIGIAGLFLALNAQFLAAIQLIVYAGAVVVLFVFVIMLLGPDAGGTQGHPARARVSRVISALVVAFLGIGALSLLLGAETTGTPFPEVSDAHGSVEAVGVALFRDGLVLFELATALLIVAVIGAIAVARSRHVVKAKKESPNPTRRLFHGPLHPRDAGHPLPRPGIRAESAEEGVL